MRRWVKLGGLLAAVVVLSALVFRASKPGFRRSFVVYYGAEWNPLLTRFDVAIVSPLFEHVDKLNDAGVLTVGYLSLCTLGDWEPWRGSVKDEWVVGFWEEWGERVVNVCEPGWRRVLLDEAIPFLVERGFRGVMLDNADMVDRYPWMRDSMAKLIESIRETYPDLYIIQNRGFSILNETCRYIDALLFEDFGTLYDFEAEAYRPLTWRELRETMKNASRVLELGGGRLEVFALAYADPNKPLTMRLYMSLVDKLASRYGFTPYVSDLNLTYVNEAYAKRR